MKRKNKTEESMGRRMKTDEDSKRTLSCCEDYECAFKSLRDTTIIAPSYYTIAGTEPNEGAVISRTRLGVANMDQLSDERWFLLQTNFD